jgi:hypothetical protein
MMELKKLGEIQCMAEKSVDTSTAGKGNVASIPEIAEEKAGSKERDS